VSRGLRIEGRRAILLSDRHRDRAKVGHVKDPSLAFALGFLIPAAGLFYVGRWVQALILVFLELVCAMTLSVGGLSFVVLILFGLSGGFYCRWQARRFNERARARC
jgi:Ca2+-dependent lipid-binding protein